MRDKKVRGGKRTHKAAIREENERLILEAAEAIFAEYGYGGATMARIADQAGVAKANVHYYFATKEDLYRRVIDTIFHVWLNAADSLDQSDEPVEALTRYIHTKMDLSRDRPLGSKVWANEIIQRAPIIQDYLETRLKEWTEDRGQMIQTWIDQGKMKPIDTRYLLYMIWATTQHYADFGHQIKTLNDGTELSDTQWQQAKKTVTEIILRGIGLVD